MAITANDWLITSDVVQEAAFRVDLPEDDRGKWVLSYLPTHRRLTRDQALAGMALAEMIVLDQVHPARLFDQAVAHLHAAELGLAVHDVMSLLALRAPAEATDQEGAVEPPCARHGSASALARGATSFAA